jgi:RNA polymerase sigma factor (sigma-70 family)
MYVNLPPFQRLVDDHWRDVARLAHALAGPVDGDDVAQQAWIQALAAYPGLQSTRNLRGWLLTVTSRCATDAHRARSRHPVTLADVEGATDSTRAAPRAPAAEEAAQMADGALWDAVRALPERQRMAIALRFVADLDHAELARQLGTTPAATRRLVSDGLSALRAQTNDLILGSPEEDAS